MLGDGNRVVGPTIVYPDIPPLSDGIDEELRLPISMRWLDFPIDKDVIAHSDLIL